MHPRRFFSPLVGLAGVLALLVSLPASANNAVPAELPRPDGKEPAKDKPVKIYIFSGQSNSLGFGRAEGGDPPYNSIFLSADPSVVPHNVPITSSAMLPHHVFTAETGDERGAKASVYAGEHAADADFSSLTPVKQEIIPLGKVDQPLPGAEGPHVVVVSGYIEVPITGTHQVHAGFEDSSYATAWVNGQEVYRRATGEEATLTPVQLEKGKRHAVKIVYTKGGNAAFWMELVGLKARGSLKALTEEGKYLCFVDDKGEWTQRSDVMVCDAYMGKGKNGPLSPMWRGGTFGPELGAGYVLGTFHDEPVIVMKADIGNRGLAWDCLPPGSERYEIDGTIYAGYKDTQSSWPKAQGEPKPGGWYAGKQYDEYTASIHHVLNNFDTLFPQYKDQGYEIAGFVWWQGHKDQNPVHASRYEQNLVNLIKAWRKEFKAPNAKFAIATIAFGGWKLDGPGKTIAEAQLAVSGDSGKYPDFKGNVKTIEARDFWRNIGESPKSQDYHYNHNAETYFLVGDALGRALVEMQGGTVEPRTLEPRPKDPATWPERPTLDEAARMIYTDAFISPWAKSDAEPTAEQIQAMSGVMKPIIMDKLIPDFVTGADNVPAHMRRGVQIHELLSGEPPKKRSGLSSQLDTLISFYKAAGIDQYQWTRFGPEMQTSEWHYYSFDPKEKPDPKSVDQYRQITMPEGMENWAAVDFDAAKAGWKLGKGPFGQKDGKQEALRDKCNNPQCACDVTPATLWEHDVLLMRQSFEIPKLDKNHRYRLVVGGGSHTWAGEGYEVYVNGKLFDTQDAGFYKNGGERGAYVFSDSLPEFESGKVTIAVKAFLRRSGQRGKSAPPTGHLSVWLEQIQIPPVLLEKSPAEPSGALKAQ